MFILEDSRLSTTCFSSSPMLNLKVIQKVYWHTEVRALYMLPTWNLFLGKMPSSQTVTYINSKVQVQGGQPRPCCIVSVAPREPICNSLKASQPSVIVNKQHPWRQKDNDILQSTYWSWKAPASLVFSRNVLCVHLQHGSPNRRHGGKHSNHVTVEWEATNIKVILVVDNEKI